MDSAKLDELIASAKSLTELGDALVKAVEALKEPAVPGETVDTFSQAELDAVLAEVDKLKEALTALKTA